MAWSEAARAAAAEARRKQYPRKGIPSNHLRRIVMARAILLGRKEIKNGTVMNINERLRLVSGTIGAQAASVGRMIGRDQAKAKLARKLVSAPSGGMRSILR